MPRRPPPTGNLPPVSPRRPDHLPPDLTAQARRAVPSPVSPSMHGHLGHVPVGRSDPAAPAAPLDQGCDPLGQKWGLCSPHEGLALSF